MVLERYGAVVFRVAFVATATLICGSTRGYADNNAPPRPETLLEEDREEAPEAPGQQLFKLAGSRSVRVTLHAFSGVPDPEWRLKAGQISKLARLVNGFKPVNLDRPLEMPSRLGYKGCSLKIKRKEGTHSTLFVYDDTIQGGQSFGSKKGSEHRLEKWLLSTAGRAVKRDVRTEVLKDIRKLARASNSNVNRRPAHNTNAPQDGTPELAPRAPK